MSTLEQIQYGFDRDSRRTWQKRPLTDTQDQQYNYDALSQVNAAARGSLNLNFTAISGVPASAQSWDYDPTGNWRGYHVAANGTTSLDQQRVHDRGNRLTQIEDNPHNMILDRVGRMRQMAPDAEGDWDGKLEITWDAWSRITSVKNNGEVVGEYAYDGTHRRTSREVDGETLHSYYNDAWRPVEERKNSETTASMSYLWGSRHRDDLVRRDRATGGTTLNETRYVLMDYFNPAAITDASGVVKERYAFSAFGVRTILNPDFTTRSSSECGMEFAFQGQFLDGESGLMNYGYRYYSPQLGRWTCKDPIGIKGGINIYQITDNCPTNKVDHLGLASYPIKIVDNQPDEIDHLDNHQEGDFLGENKWFEQNYYNLITEARTFFIGQVNIWVVQNCRKSPYTAPLLKAIWPQFGVRVKMSSAIWGDTMFGDKGQNDWWTTNVLGKFTLNVTVPIDIEYETPNADGNIQFRWKAIFQVGDTLGYQPGDGASDFLNKIAPSANVIRARWTLNGIGSCCPEKT